MYANWSGSNSSSVRRNAAIELYGLMTSEKNPYRDLKHATLIGHSHGGNVNKILKKLLQKDGWRVDIINIETPRRSDFQASDGNGIYMNFYSNTDLVQYLGTSDYAIPEINEAERGARRDKNASLNFELNTYTRYGDKNVKRSVVAPLVYILEGAANALEWVFKTGAGHSVHGDKQSQKQITDKTKEVFKNQKP